MLELFREALALYNLPITILLGVVVIYWGLVGVGLLDFDTDGGLDLGHTGDLHVGPDVDMDAHVDAHVEHSVPGADHDHSHLHHGPDAAHGPVRAALQFLNFGDVPSMIVVSILTLSFWTFSMVGNHYFNNGSLVRAALLLVPNFLITVALTKILTTPLKKLFTELNRDFDEHKPIIGRTCTIITSEVNDQFGQAQIETSGAPLVINVRTYGGAVFSKGEPALIIKEEKDTQIYTVAKLSTANPQPQSTLC